MNGTIAWIARDRRYGFVTPEDGGDDLFFRLDTQTAERLGAPAPGQAVHFTVEAGIDGAEAVRLAPGAMPAPEGF